MSDLATIEQERVALLAAWDHFRSRLRQQRGGRLRGIQQSLVPMLSELLLEVKDGYECRELLASASFGRTYVFTSEEEGKKRLVSPRPPSGEAATGDR